MIKSLYLRCNAHQTRRLTEITWSLVTQLQLFFSEWFRKTRSI